MCGGFLSLEHDHVGSNRRPVGVRLLRTQPHGDLLVRPPEMPVLPTLLPHANRPRNTPPTPQTHGTLATPHDHPRHRPLTPRSGGTDPHSCGALTRHRFAGTRPAGSRHAGLRPPEPTRRTVGQSCARYTPDTAGGRQASPEGTLSPPTDEWHRLQKPPHRGVREFPERVR